MRPLARPGMTKAERLRVCEKPKPSRRETMPLPPLASSPARPAPGPAGRPSTPAYKRQRICYSFPAPNLYQRAPGDRHGQGSDAQQQGKEETEGRQEPQKGRRRAGQSVRDRQTPGRPKPQQQEELTSG